MIGPDRTRIGRFLFGNLGFSCIFATYPTPKTQQMKNIYATLLTTSALLLAGSSMAQSHGKAGADQLQTLRPAHVRGQLATHGNAMRGGGAPANDECSAAEMITLVPTADCASSLITGNNGASTISTGDPSCDGSTAGYQDVWYSFNSDTNSVVTVEMANVDGTDWCFTVQPTCDPGAEISCNINPSGPIQVNVTPNTDYYIRVYANAQFGAGGEFTLCVSFTAQGPTPVNDECTGAVNQDLAVGSTVTFTGDNTGATDNGEGLGIAAVWEQFTTSECANLELTYCGTTPPFGNGFSRIYQGCPFTLSIAAASFDDTTCADGNFTLFFEDVPAGTYYYPVMLDPANNAEGPYTISVTASECVAHTAYCIPNPVNGTSDGDYITNVELGDINYSAPSDTNYVDNTNLSTDLARDGNYTMTIIGGAYAPDTYAAWIDYNNDFVFSANEKLGEAQTVTDSAEVVTINFTVPATADLGPARLRVRCVYSIAGNIEACTDYTYGETEDYTVNILMSVGVAENSASLFSVLPNPSNGDFQLVAGHANGPAVIEMMDMAGRTVYNEQANLNTGARHTISLAGKLAPGTYALRVRAEAGVTTRMVVVK